MNEYDRLYRQAQRYKELYPKGTRILLLHMGNDPRPVENDMRGTVMFVDDMSTVHCRWLENLLPRNEADKLLGRLGATVTDYGVISARNSHLFKPVPYDEPEAKELKTQALTEEKLDVIEVLDRRALFSNGRLMPEEIPEGLYAYDLRHSDNGDRFCSIEPKVGVNHGGTVLMRDILDFGENGYIPLDEDTEPNFLGETMTVSEFAEEEAQDEAMQMGGM